MPLVTVVVPNYNHGRFLRERLDSIVGQKFQDFELILLDDCSNDDSCTILREYAANRAGTKTSFNSVNSGSTFKQWNRGVLMATGKYVWIAESDDYADERLLGSLVGCLESEPQAALCNCRSWLTSDDGRVSEPLDSLLSFLDLERWKEDFCSDGREECRKYLVHCNTVQSASSVLFLRQAYLEIGGADEKLVLTGDWKTWASLAMRGKICHLGQLLNYCRVHEYSVSSNSKRNGIWLEESLRLITWLIEYVAADDMRLLRSELSKIWMPVAIDRTVPADRRFLIIKEALRIDPVAMLRRVRFLSTPIKLTLKRRWESLFG